MSRRLIFIFSAFVRNSPDKPVSNRHFFSAVSMKNESPASAQNAWSVSKVLSTRTVRVRRGVIPRVSIRKRDEPFLFFHEMVNTGKAPSIREAVRLQWFKLIMRICVIIIRKNRTHGDINARTSYTNDQQDPASSIH